MDVFVVLQQMLVLLVMMLIGYVAFRLSWLDDHACSKISKIVINILNPCIVINGVIGKEADLEPSMLLQTLMLAVVYFGFLILVSKPVASLLRVKGEYRNIYRLMMVFSNVGFMGIPVISSIYGKESIVLIAFYMLGYNLLLYTYGIYLASDNSGISKEGKKGQWKKLINPGVISCIAAFVIFVSGVTVPDSVCTFFDYMGNSVVPFSMILIGASVAQQGKKEFWLDKKMYLFMAIKLLMIPITAALVLRCVPWNGLAEGVFVLMLSMPVGSIIVLLAKEYGADEMECTKGIMLTTILSVITIPIVAMFITS